MNFIELQEGLQKLTNKKITQSDFARMLGVGRANIHDRIKRNSSVTTDEIELIQRILGVNFFIYSFNNIYDNSLKLNLDNSIIDKFSKCINRIKDIQYKNKLSDFQLAGILNISENQLSNILSGKNPPDISFFNNIKQNFNVSIDWVLYGD